MPPGMGDSSGLFYFRRRVMGRYDHFHAIYTLNEVPCEIEGGWTGYPEGWEAMTDKDQWEWYIELVRNWGMPHEAILEHFWLAG